MLRSRTWPLCGQTSDWSAEKVRPQLGREPFGPCFKLSWWNSLTARLDCAKNLFNSKRYVLREYCCTRAPLGTPLGRDPYRPVREGSSHGRYTSRTEAGGLASP